LLYFVVSLNEESPQQRKLNLEKLNIVKIFPFNQAAWSKELAILILLTIIARLPWLVMVPMAEAPDEVTHAWVIHFLADQMRLPALADVRSAGSIAVYGPIPQFGYLAHVAFLKLSPQLPQLISMRLGSLFMSIISIVVAHFISRRVFLPERLLALGLPLLMVFHPQFVLVSSYANNDITACALSSLVLLLLLETLERGTRFVISLTIGVLLAWLTLSKYSGCFLLPITLIALTAASWLHRTGAKKFVFNLVSILAPCFLLTGAWFARNAQEFEGDITGTRTLHMIWTSTYHRKFDSYRSPLVIVLESRWWRMNFFSFWGWFGYMTRSLPRPFYYGYLVFVIAAFCGGIRKLTTLREKWFIHSQRMQLVKPFIWLIFIFMSLANLFTSLAASSSGIAGPQGRYLFISEIPLMALLLGGLANLPSRWSKPTIWALLLFNLGTYFYSSAYLYSIYCQAH
jgi:4-amino-4-deoxy-L-arabinose transferase-like glycosyltransferase